jgi:hypothetical protein
VLFARRAKHSSSTWQPRPSITLTSSHVTGKERQAQKRVISNGYNPKSQIFHTAVYKIAADQHIGTVNSTPLEVTALISYMTRVSCAILMGQDRGPGQAQALLPTWMTNLTPTLIGRILAVQRSSRQNCMQYIWPMNMH